MGKLEKVLDTNFYKDKTEVVAKKLLGQYLVRKLDNGTLLIGMITEVEAYLPKEDEAAHNFIGKTKRNEILFGEAGFTYVHSIHRYHCIDIVTEDIDVPGSVLIRALKPMEGIEVMKSFRNLEDKKLLTNGPGRLCQAMDITRILNGIDVTSNTSQIYITKGINIEESDIVLSKRIGISKAKDMMLRFHIKGSEYLSR